MSVYLPDFNSLPSNVQRPVEIDQESPEKPVEGSALFGEPDRIMTKRPAKSRPISSILNGSEFNKNLIAWFGERGFVVMRSFFRANVLNSLQKQIWKKAQLPDTQLVTVTVLLIADFFLTNSQFFTMSVYSNEVLKSLSKTNAIVRDLFGRVGKSRHSGSILTEDDVLFIVGFFGVDSQSQSARQITTEYFQGRKDLMSILLNFMKKKMNKLTTRDVEEIAASLTDNINEEMEKFRDWLSGLQFEHFPAVLNRIRVESRQKGESLDQKVAENENVSERLKLAQCAKELKTLHEEIIRKWEAVRDYEKSFLKRKERNVSSINATTEDYNLQQHDKYSKIGNVCHTKNNFKDVATQCFDEHLQKHKSNENQHSTRVLSEKQSNCHFKTNCSRLPFSLASSTLNRLAHEMTQSCSTANREEQSLEKFLSMSAAVRRARAEINGLKNEQISTEKRYNFLISSQLSSS